MKVWKFYILWTTRNGQQLWDGPFNSEMTAAGVLATMTANYESGNAFILRDSVEVPDGV